MEDVPVKIVERYKPPPLVYQLPQTIANRLAQNYDEQSYHYDFHLERTVLNKCQHWRRMRDQQQQMRQVRQEQRKQQRQRALEAIQKEMLGAVDYPSAADLSSDSDDDNNHHNDDDDKIAASSEPVTTTEISEPKSINSCNFHNILQPTILSSTTATPVVTHHKRNSSLNYADFEYNMNSTPFDNIELKTINDLDILAQVLHQTQLTQAAAAAAAETEQEQESGIQPKPEEEQKLELTVTTLAETKATLDSVNFQVHCDDASDIPAISAQMWPQQQKQQVYQQQSYYPQVSGQNQQQQLYMPHVYANGYGTPTHLPQSSNFLRSTQETDADIKSKSVPDILRELKTELHQADKRRARLHSHNENDPRALPLALPHQKDLAVPSPVAHLNNANIFQALAVPAQKLAQRISGMGFPLERVAKVVSLCGIDDKKIIEHLIPLGELMDLGFEETKISAALLKFDNNKDKALDYLIK